MNFLSEPNLIDPTFLNAFKYIKNYNATIRNSPKSG